MMNSIMNNELHYMEMYEEMYMEMVQPWARLITIFSCINFKQSKMGDGLRRFERAGTSLSGCTSICKTLKR
jgi:hypothetical protein